MTRAQRTDAARAWLRPQWESGASARSLARLCDVDVTTILRLVDGDAVPQAETLAKIEAAKLRIPAAAPSSDGAA